MADREAIAVLWATAQALAAGAGLPDGLPPLLFVTDPGRVPDPVAVAGRLPRGAGVIYRAFGASDAVGTAFALREVADAQGLVLLVGLDAALAEACGADGLHLPERMLGQGLQLRLDHPDWILTGAAHDREALAAAEAAGLDAVLLSPVFQSRSPSARAPLGLERFSALCAATDLPVYALGGVVAGIAPGLIGAGAAGIAAVDAFLGP